VLLGDLVLDMNNGLHEDIRKLLWWLTAYYNSYIRWHTQTLKHIDSAIRTKGSTHRRRMVRYLRRPEEAFEKFRNHLLVLIDEVDTRRAITLDTWRTMKYITAGTTFHARHCKVGCKLAPVSNLN